MLYKNLKICLCKPTSNNERLLKALRTFSHPRVTKCPWQRNVYFKEICGYILYLMEKVITGKPTYILHGFQKFRLKEQKHFLHFPNIQGRKHIKESVQLKTQAIRYSLNTKDSEHRLKCAEGRFTFTSVYDSFQRSIQGLSLRILQHVLSFICF